MGIRLSNAKAQAGLQADEQLRWLVDHGTRKYFPVIALFWCYAPFLYEPVSIPFWLKWCQPLLAVGVILSCWKIFSVMALRELPCFTQKVCRYLVTWNRGDRGFVVFKYPVDDTLRLILNVLCGLLAGELFIYRNKQLHIKGCL